MSARRGWMPLLALALLLGGAASAQAEDCSEYPNGVLDGATGTPAPSQIKIDRNCTIRNYPASNPLGTNFSFLTQPGQSDERWLVVFDNVVHTGQMACNSVAGHKIWFTNGSSTSIQEGCQNLLIPVEKIDKQNPPGTTTAAIGVPFTYSLVIPVLFDPATGAVINTEGSVNDLHSILITDDLNETGVDLTYLGHTATWLDSGAPVSHTFSNAGGLLTFDVDPVVPAGDQMLIEITVVLEDTPTNAPGTQFVNRAVWQFGRLIDGVFHEPLPGEWGISPPLTIAAPELVMTKTGPATLGRTLNLGEYGTFTLDVQNTGLTAAWDVTLLDRLPDGATGGMCDTTPEILSAQVFEADGSTPVSAPLVQGSDYGVSYAGAPTCELSLTMFTPAAAIGPDQRLIVTYRSKIDADSQDGVALTNVAGATEWFNGEASNPDRVTFTRTLTDGTVGIADHEDAHTVTVALFGYVFEKSVENLTSGVSPTATAAPGDTLRYTLRLQATDVPLTDLGFRDDLGDLNAGAVFVPGSLSVVSLPAGADASGTDPFGGSNGDGLLDVSNLNVAAASEITVQFDVVVEPTLTDGTVLLNQSDLISAGTDIADSDDPNINGQADPTIPGDEDPTRVVIAEIPVGGPLKQTTQATATIGEAFAYRITVPETPYPYDLYDVQIADDLALSEADLRLVGVSRISGSQAWVPVNTGTGKSVLIEDTSTGIDIPAGEQIVVEIEVVLEDTPANVAGLVFTNTATFLHNEIDGNDGTREAGDAGVSGPMTIVEPALTMAKSGPAQMTTGTPAGFVLDVQNAGDSPAFELEISDQLPDGATGGTCDVAPTVTAAQVFEADGTTPVSGSLAEGVDFDTGFDPAPACVWTLRFTSAQTALGVGERLILGYETQLDADTQASATLTNVAGATEWKSTDGSDPRTASDRRVHARVLTDGTVGTVDHEDAHTLATGLPDYLFEKTVVDPGSGAPLTTAAPGDTLRYRLRLENRGATPLSDLGIRDELDRLNTPASFAPGTLTLVTLPAGADPSGTDPNGGAQGTGVVDVDGLTVAAGATLLLEFDVTLAAVIANGTAVTNQSQLLLNGVPFVDSDDPGVNGAADPTVAGDEDPTVVQILSAPDFQVEKVSTYVTGDPSVLLAGETLRYTITVKNVGNDDASDALLRDAVPVNTQYVAGSTTLNGTPVPDAAGGTSPLSGGIAIHAPEDPTPGAMRADPSATPDNVATIVFDVVVDASVPDGTVISNQAFVSAPAGGVSDQPSDDPRTPIVDDPTRDVVGNAPLLFAPKTVALGVDAGTPGIVDPGDVLHYTITIHNTGAVSATGVVLTDAVPADTTYVADSTLLNGLPVGQPDGGVPPLAAGIPISSSDRTPPLPGAGEGTLTPGQSAVLEFDLQVNAGTPAGTIISNQAVVTSNEVTSLLTDGDGNPATGPEPTQVVVGAAQQLSISKSVSVVGGGAALAGSTLEYVVHVVNIAAVPAHDVVITDDLDTPTPGQLAYVAGSATLNGSAAEVSVAGPLLTADYSTANGPLAPGESLLLRFRAVIDPGLAMGTTVTNVGVVSWNDPPQTASASVSIDVGGMPGVGVLNGRAWHDADFDDAVDPGELLLGGWAVELYRNGQPIQSVVTDTDGTFQISGVAPNDANGDSYELRFSGPGAGANSAALGFTASDFTDGPQRIGDIVVSSGANLQDLDLPIDPNGVVYDAVGRTPVGGARLTLLGAGGAQLPASCFDDPVQQGQVTRADGYFKFDLDFSDASCPSGGSYLIAVVPPGSGFVAGTSAIIPPASDGSTAAFSVPACPGSANDAVPTTAQHCEVQASEFAPPQSVAPRTAGTTYHLHLQLDAGSPPGTSQLFNNHLPVDPVLDGAVAITKSTPSLYVSRGALVPYEIGFTNSFGADLLDLTIVDRFPTGFSYVQGSARVDGVPVEPTIDGQQLTWTDVGLPALGSRRIALLLAVGGGVTEGEFVNRAQAVSSLTSAALSGEATATVRVAPDFTFDCTDVLGRVFDDANHNGVQDAGERGLGGVRLATARGLIATTDPFGRFHITCAAVPREERGSNFVLKLDDRTLPSGYRMTTRPSQVLRASRGKALRFHFGATVHRVVGLDIADPVFEPGTAQMRAHWRPRIRLLLEELEKRPSILRLSYVGDLEAEGLAERRVEAVKREIAEAWGELDDAYELPIETEIFWRRGKPLAEAPEPSGGWRSLLPSVDAGPPVVDAEAGESAERPLPLDEPYGLWAHDPELLERQLGDRIERREVLTEQAKTVKLSGVVPPIRFESGVADIPPDYLQRLRGVLDSMRHLQNVRLHLVGHADSEPLSPTLSGVFGDNRGLSRERAGEVAEFVQAALALPPEAISFAWAGDGQPIASNATEAGRALNRRVEVEIWYDEMVEQPTTQEVVVPEEFRRFKVCRTETVCKLRYREGDARRARLRNLLPPLRHGEDAVEVPSDFVEQIRETLHDLRDKRNVTVKFVGFTDDVPLSGRMERIYGTHAALSKAQAHRVALAVKDALDLPNAAVASDGRGASQPVASNQTQRGRALNRRIEVEFWHDDPLNELPDEPQPCPDAAAAEVVTKVYDPPWGRIEALPIQGGNAVVPERYAETLRRALGEVADKANVRLRFVGYTGNEPLDRRTAIVYEDDVGLSAARARRTMERIREQLGLAEERVEHEGRGYVHSNDVVNAGFVQGESSYVAVQVVYDELAVLDGDAGLEVTPITRELRAKEPLALNLMRITVDGVPIDDPGRSSADIQRCTDVALDRANVEFRFDDLAAEPRLGVGTLPLSTPAPGEDGEPAGGPGLTFRTASNYPHFIDRSEVRIFERGRSLQSEPLAVVPVEADGLARWQPEPERLAEGAPELRYLLRAYDTAGRFDETEPQPLRPTHREGAASGSASLRFGRMARNIPLGSVGSVRVNGSGIPPDHGVWLAGAPIPVDEHGSFVADVVLPAGLHTVELAVLDPAGNGELFLRDLELERSDWFYVGIADLTLSADLAGGRPEALQGRNAPHAEDALADGRLAFFVKGKFGEGWGLTASADTREEPVEDLFTNFLDKSPDSLFRRIDPDYHYPTFGDDGTVDEAAPTQGKLYLKLDRGDSHLMWGNFKVGYLDNELAHVDRGLYGANLHYQTEATTGSGEQRLVLDAYAAEPGTVSSREEFRGTGGSLFYLRRQDVLVGSERLRVEVRDKLSGLVTSVVHLRPRVDYDIDYLQGRILLTEPIASIVDDALLVRSGGLSGDEPWLVAQYEYTPGFDELDALSAGGEGRLWLNDFVKLGLTANHNEEGDVDSSLYAANLTVRKTADSWLKLQAGRSEGLVSSSLRSDDGGFSFLLPGATLAQPGDGLAYRADVSVAVADFVDGARGRMNLYGQVLEDGYSAPGLSALTDTRQYGGSFGVPVTEQLEVAAKADWRLEDEGLQISAQELDLGYRLGEHWKIGAGVRNDEREDASPLVPATQEEGGRTDAVVQLGFDSGSRWRSYLFGQGTVRKSGDREENSRGGIGGAYRMSERLSFDGEVSHGTGGPAARLGTSFQQTDATRWYLSYALDNERTYTGLRERRGNLVSGFRSRLSDSSSVYLEDRFQHGDSANGLSRAMGVTFAPHDRWSLSASWERGTLVDTRTSAETRRSAGGARVGYHLDRLQLSSGVEYRFDESEQLDGSWTERTTWLFRNTLRYQVTPGSRVVGKVNHSFSESSQGQFYDGGFTEAVVGFALRPVAHDRFHLLGKYTYFYDVPAPEQVTIQGTASQFLQKSHVAALDLTYDLTRNLSVGGKYAYRLGQVSVDRENPDFFDNDAHLAILRADLRFLTHYEGAVEGRLLLLPDLEDQRAGARVTLYRYLGDHFKIGVGYNFTDFSDDLTDLSYDHHGLFFNLVGTL